MNRKAVALMGITNVGKSWTVKKVYELLLSKYKDATTDEDPKPILPVRGDIRVVLTINGVKIGIESQGDPKGRLVKKPDDSISLFVDVGCEVIICATRKCGQTVDAVNVLGQKNYYVIWFKQEKKKSASEWEQSNLAMANKLVKEAEKIINAE